MKKHNGDPIPPERLEGLTRLEAMPDEDIDLGDMPEATDWSDAVQGPVFSPDQEALRPATP